MVGIAALLPATLLGRKQASKVRSFSRDTLYEYVNGHAEYYISAGFRALRLRSTGPTPRASRRSS